TRFDLELTPDPDFVVYSSFGLEHTTFDCTRIFYTGENDRPNFRACDFAFTFDYLATPRNYRLPLYAFYNHRGLLGAKAAAALFAAKSRFCAFVYSNGRAHERIALLDKLSRYKRVDCGGAVRNNIGYRVKDKIEFMRDYKFSIAFENASAPGYTTEK